MVQYKCIKTCFFNNRVYKVGELLKMKDSKKVPSHFVPANKFPYKKEEESEVKDKKAVKAVGHAKAVKTAVDRQKKKKNEGLLD